MPYYAMLDRLRVFLRTDQCVLLTCGYSFADEHINAYIGQGLSGNPNASCIAMIFKDRIDVPKAVTLATRHANLTVVAADGGVVGTVDRSWHRHGKGLEPSISPRCWNELPDWRTKAPAEQCKWLLGDFAAFGEFLAYQLSTRDIEQTYRMRPDPTQIGTVQDVAGTSISVSLVNHSATGLSFFKGKSLQNRTSRQLCTHSTGLHIAFRHRLPGRSRLRRSGMS